MEFRQGEKKAKKKRDFLAGKGSFFPSIYIILVYIFLFFPVAVIFLFSFNISKTLIWPIKGLTWKWYLLIFTNSTLLDSIKNSLKVATWVMLISTIIGTIAAFALVRYESKMKNLITAAMLAPIITPGLVVGISLLSYFHFLGIPRSLATVAIGHLIWICPFVTFIITTGLQRFDKRLEEAALDLGAPPLKVFFTITLPIISPTIIGGAIIAFALSFDEFIITFFVIGQGSTLPMQIWSMLHLGHIGPSINAIASIVLFLSFGFTFLFQKLTGGKIFG